MADSFLDLQNLALSNDFDGDTYRQQAKRAINDALQDMSRRGAIPKLEQTDALAVTSQTVDLPADNVRLLHVYVDSPRQPVQEISMDEFDELASPATGVPRSFAVFSGTIYLYPAPVSQVTLVVRYRREPTTLVNDADNLGEIPDGYGWMLVAFARSRLFAFEDDAQMAQYWMGEYERMLGLLRADVGRRDLGRVRQVPGMWSRSPAPSFVRPN